MKIGILQFPGSNCDQDMFHVAKNVLGQEAVYLWHKDPSLHEVDAVVVVPGGFSYGDYLRCGAIARFSPVMRSVAEFASRGGPVLGICNGFQVLCEAGLLPGALIRNQGLHFICKHVHIRVETPTTPFTNDISTGQVLRVPIAHGEGNYYAEASVLEKMQQNHQILFRYSDERGRTTPESNPNGSRWNIAGICNESRNVVGLMPHPERAAEAILGSTDGRQIFDSLLNHLSTRA